MLQEVQSLPVGHAKDRRHVCRVTALAIDTVSRTASKLWQQNNLPHDSLRLLSLKQSSLLRTGHVLLVSLNAVLVLSCDTVVGAATNGFAALTVANHIKLQAWPYDSGIELDCSHWLEASPSCIVGTLKDGRALTVQFTGLLDNCTALDYLRFQVSFLDDLPSATSTCCSNRSGDLWFLGSRQAMCSLLRVDKIDADISDKDTKLFTEYIMHSYESAEKKALSAIVPLSLQQL